MAKINHSQETIDTICKLRKAGLSCEKISKETNLTKNVVLALVYKHYLKINRHKVYKPKSKEVSPMTGRNAKPSVAFVKGLQDTKFYRMVKCHADM